MTPEPTNRFEYDVALSFASVDRASAEALASLLVTKNFKIHYDELEAGRIPEDKMVLHLAELYRTKASYCVILVSRHYPLQTWTKAEQTAAQEHALRDANEYILPVILDESDAPGVTDQAGFAGLQRHSIESLVRLLEKKLNQIATRTSPPPKSHDLRSGNIPPKQ